MTSLYFNPNDTGHLTATGSRSEAVGQCAPQASHIRTRRQVIDSVTVVSLVGDLDARTAPTAHQELVAALPARTPVLIDLSELGYVSSAGLRAMLLVYRQAQQMGIPIALVGLSTELRNVLTATGFLNFFRVAENISDGLSVLRNP